MFIIIYVEGKYNDPSDLEAKIRLSNIIKLKPSLGIVVWPHYIWCISEYKRYMRTLSLNAKPKNKDIGLHNIYDKYTVSTRNERCQKIAEQNC